MRVAAIALLCVAAVAGAAAYDAVVRVWPTSGNTVTGLVTITKIGDGSYDFVFNLNGLAPSTTHGVHVHNFGDLSSADGTAAGTHFNPFSAPHACPGTSFRHAGDLGNFTTDATGAFVGTINSEVRDPNTGLDLTFSASSDPIVNGNAIGRGLVIHANPDDCKTQATGNSGARVGMGVIGVALNAATIGSYYGGALALHAKLYNTTGGEFGRVWIRNDTSSATAVEVYAYIWGLIPGSVHGLHIHQYGDHTFLNASNALTHFNPNGGNHALPYEATDAHMGDLGNVIADSNGVVVHHAWYDAPQHLINLQGAVQNIIGRAVVLHSWPDQGRNATVAATGALDQTGGAGSRLGMGVLGITGTNGFPTAASEVNFSRNNLVRAYAKLFGTSKRPGATGTVEIVHGDDNLAAITVKLSGMAPNVQYAIHVHDFGDMTNADGTSAGGHYNPFGWAHNCYPARGKRHTGDIGNLPNTTANGDVNVTLFRDWISLAGENSTIGRSLIVHGANDDCQTQPTGNAGSRWLQGVLGNAANALGFSNASSSNPGPKTPLVGLMAVFSPTSNAAGAVTGTAYIFTDTDGSTTVVRLNIAGLPPSSSHGIHVHTYGDWTAADGSAAGGHWNPLGNPHATPEQANVRHAGDLGNILADANGNFAGDKRVINLPIQNIAGRAIVIHRDLDQGNQVPDVQNGNAGPRIALGVLGVLNTATVIPTPTANTTDSSSTGGCPADQICAGSMATPSVAALIAGALLLAVIRRD